MTKDYARNYRPQAKPRNTRVAPSKRGAPGWVWLLAGALIGSLLTGVLLYDKDAPIAPDPMASTAEVVEETAPPPPSHKPRFDFYTLLKETEVLVPDENGELPAKTVVIPDAKEIAADTAKESSDKPTTPAAVENTSGKIANTPVATAKLPEAAPTVAKSTDKPAPPPTAQPQAVTAPSPPPSAAPVAPPAPAPAATPPAQERSQYVLQAGSFKNASDADSVRARLLLLNMHASVDRVSANGGETWHRVMIGPFNNPDDAARASALLRQNGIDSIQVKRRN